MKSEMQILRFYLWADQQTSTINQSVYASEQQIKNCSWKPEQNQGEMDTNTACKIKADIPKMKY